MKYSMIALVDAGGVALAAAGYAVGSTRSGDSSELSAQCQSARQEFETRAGQIRRQTLAPSGEDESRATTMIAARVKIVSAIVERHADCFEVDIRAVVEVLRQSPSAGEADVAVCDLTGIRPEDCGVSSD